MGDINDVDYVQQNNTGAYDEDDDNNVHPERNNQMMRPQPTYEKQRHEEPTVIHEDELTLRDLRAAQMKRSALEKICTEPFFAEFISPKRVPIPNDPDYDRLLPGLFCRVYIGDRDTSSGTKQPIYRICEMLGVEDYRHSYQLTDKRTMINFGLLITHASNKRVFKIIQTSNSPFTQREFEDWKARMKADRLRLPAKDDLSEAFLSASKLHKNFKYDSHQIAKMKAKKSLNYNARSLPNPHKEKLRVSTLLNGMGDDEDYDVAERSRLEKYLGEINLEIDRRKNMNSHAVKISIASINEKNKIKNKKLMLKAREKERRMRILNKGKKAVSDPFTRAITAPKIESFNSVSFEEDKEEKKKEAEEEEEERKKKMGKRKSKHEEHMEALQTLSILEEHEKRKRIKSEGLGVNSLDDVGDVKDGRVLIRNDKLWNSAIHSVAIEFVNKCKEIEIDCGGGGGLRQPQFGRNTNKSKYANRFMKRPRNLQIISIDEYLKTKKYSAM